jgi:TFIIF-interacting CTD phosphatase-like protein
MSTNRILLRRQNEKNGIDHRSLIKYREELDSLFEPVSNAYRLFVTSSIYSFFMMLIDLCWPKIPY